ncbi:Enolase-phosphatase E1 OS=Rhodanobacter lindaniclasticus OX=75310 GN=mtnC PE=3 SV=1 [Rhodanobacter lindaniclasticus]
MPTSTPRWPPACAWRADGLRLYVYSSGSVPAQQLFFQYSEAGDLTPLFAGYFDTETGPKREASSYRRIAEAVGEEPRHLLFLSDIVEELDAARAAGFHTGWLVREPQPLPAAANHPGLPRLRRDRPRPLRCRPACATC